MAIVALVTGLVALHFTQQASPNAGLADQVSAEEVARRAGVLNALMPVHLAPVKPADEAAAIAQITLPLKDQIGLVADMAAKRTKLVFMSFYDSDAEDGDVITVQSAGFTQALLLAKAPMTIALPASSDGHVKVTGTVDGGGGGVTVGVVTPGGPVPIAVLSVGQQISVPVVVE